jgi:hypothetical protein
MSDKLWHLPNIMQSASHESIVTFQLSQHFCWKAKERVGLIKIPQGILTPIAIIQVEQRSLN